MKFVHINIPAVVEHYDPITQDVEETETGTLSIQMFVGDNVTTADALKRLGAVLTDKMALVDLGEG